MNKAPTSSRYKKLSMSFYMLGAVFLIVGLMLNLVIKPVDAQWDGSNLVFNPDTCTGNCLVAHATVCNTGSGAMASSSTYQVWFRATGNPAQGEVVASGTIPALAAGACTTLTYDGSSRANPNGNYKFELFQTADNPNGSLFSGTCHLKDVCLVPTNTPVSPTAVQPTPTNTLVVFTPTATNTLVEFTPTATNTSLPTNTDTPTNTAVVTNTATPVDTATAAVTGTPADTATATPVVTDTVVVTDTPMPTPGVTDTVVVTDTPVPTPGVTETVVVVETPIPTPVESETVVVVTDTPVPTPVASDTVVVSTDTPAPTPGTTSTSDGSVTDTPSPTDSSGGVSTPVPTLKPPTNTGGNVLIPVTGIDPVQGARGILINMGFIMFGLGLVFQGLNRRH